MYVAVHPSFIWHREPLKSSSGLMPSSSTPSSLLYSQYRTQQAQKKKKRKEY